MSQRNAGYKARRISGRVVAAPLADHAFASAQAVQTSVHIFSPTIDHIEVMRTRCLEGGQGFAAISGYSE